MCFFSGELGVWGVSLLVADCGERALIRHEAERASTFMDMAPNRWELWDITVAPEFDPDEPIMEA